MEITNERLIRLWNVLSELGKEKSDVKFAYAIAKNKKRVEPEINALTDAQKLTDEFQAYEKKRIEICNEMCKKDDDGNNVTDNGEFKIEDKPKFNKKIEKLQKEYKEDIDEQKKRIDDFNDILKAKVEMDFYNIKAEYLPKDIKPDHLELLLDFLEGEPE